MMFNKEEAFRLHKMHCSGCSDYDGHGGGRVSTLSKAREGDSTDAGSTPARSTTLLDRLHEAYACQCGPYAPCALHDD